MATPRGLDGILGTDQYELTMSQVYWKEGLAERTAQFDYFFRRYPDYGPHQAGYCIAAGMSWLVEWMQAARFETADLETLRSQRGAAGERRFDEGFLDWLADKGNFGDVEISAVPEGRVVHANAPMAIVRGPLAMAQILETSLLNRLNYPTLVATKASRVNDAAHGNTVLEFGMRRGPHSGAHAGVRAALIGGADFTSNVALSHLEGLDPKGTHAHSLVQAFMALGDSELEAFRKFALTYPDECVLLVDTIDVEESGVPNAITVFEELRREGHEPAGIRIDSGDLAYMTIQAARLLDAAGFEDTPIVLSSDLDELLIWQILAQLDAEAARHGLNASSLTDRVVFGVGTKLITSHGDPALGGVYKLVAITDDTGRWRPAIKISEDAEKMATPGAKKVVRLYDGRGLATADVIAEPADDLLAGDRVEMFHPHRDLRRSIATADISASEDLLQPAFADGTRQDGSPDIGLLRSRRAEDMARLDPGVRRLVNPHIYHVSLTKDLKDLQAGLVADLNDRDPG